MKTERFYRLLSNPGLLNHETAIELKSVVDEFPFFQTAWMLLLKNLKEIGSPDYEIILKKTAVRIPDRKLLYNFLNEGESSSLPIGDVSKIQSYKLGKEGQKAEGD
ncbi:MAG: hypothetical protein J7L95_04000, partial [Prolixibacteraceae bacterium]|nr:hypothetical protein [Prolixibacteraceae bacterium]